MSWLYYLIEANTYLLVFYLCYRLLLANNTHYTLGRVYLIASCILAFVIPFTQVSSLKPATKTIKVATQDSYELPANLNKAQIFDNHSFNFTLDNLLPYLYIGGAVIAAIIFTIRLSKLFAITKTGTKFDNGSYQRIDLPDGQTAFSFFNYLYIGKGLQQPETIIAHELVHIRQKHTLDILFLEVLKIFNWFSPVVYLVQQSLKTVHEYIADEQTAAQEDDALTYSSFLLNNAYGLPGASVTHSFFNTNLLKRRIIMLNQKRSGKLARLKYLAALPLCAGMLCTSTLLFSKDYGVIKVGPDKKVVKIAEDSAIYTLKITDNKTGNTIISDKMVYTDPKTGEKTAYTVSNFSDKKRNELLKRQNFVVEKIRRDTLKSNQTQKMPPPPPPAPPIKLKKAPKMPPPPPPIVKNKKTGKEIMIEEPIPAPRQMPPPPPMPNLPVFTDLIKYMGKYTRYPSVAYENRVTGHVILSLTINADHKITNVHISKGIGSGCDEEAARALRSYTAALDKAPGNYKFAVTFMLANNENTKFYTPKPLGMDDFKPAKPEAIVGQAMIVGMLK